MTFQHTHTHTHQCCSTTGAVVLKRSIECSALAWEQPWVECLTKDVQFRWLIQLSLSLSLPYIIQMRMTYDAVLFGDVKAINSPSSLGECCSAHVDFMQVCNPPPQFSRLGPALLCVALRKWYFFLF